MKRDRNAGRAPRHRGHYLPASSLCRLLQQQQQQHHRLSLARGSIVSFHIEAKKCTPGAVTAAASQLARLSIVTTKLGLENSIGRAPSLSSLLRRVRSEKRAVDLYRMAALQQSLAGAFFSFQKDLAFAARALC